MSDENKKGIEVCAEAASKSPPDKALIAISVSKRGRKGLQKEVRETFHDLKKVLVANGILEKDIETTDYQALKLKDELFSKEYLFSQGCEVTVRDLEYVGKIIDLINGCGDAEVRSVRFGIDDETFDKLKNEASSKAAAKLKEKAKTIAEVLSVKLGKPLYVAEEIKSGGYGAAVHVREWATADYYEARSDTVTPSEIKVHELSIAVKLRGLFSTV